MTNSPAILIADDDPLICKMFSIMLGRAGYQVTIAGDGDEALEQIAEKAPDLLILDYMMPCMNGIEVLNHLVREPQTAAIPVLFISAVATEMDLAHEPVTKKMMVDILPKPVGLRQMLDRVGQLLQRAQSAVVH